MRPEPKEPQVKTLDRVRVRIGDNPEWALMLLTKRKKELESHLGRFPYTLDENMAETVVALDLLFEMLHEEVS